MTTIERIGPGAYPPRPATVVTRPNQWDTVISTVGRLKPSPWSKLYNSDGVHWIGETCSGRQIGLLATYYYRRGFTVPSGGIGRATIWITADDTCMVRVINSMGVSSPWLPGPRNYFYELKRIDITDYVTVGRDSIEIKVINRCDSSTGVIYYLSVDYDDELEYSHTYNNGTGWYLVSLPVRPIPTYPNLASIFTRVLHPYIYVWHHVYTRHSIYSPLVGAFADTIRTYSFFILLADSATLHLFGFPIYEQRYLDLRTDFWHDPWLMHGTVMCDVPFNYMIDEPDDEPDEPGVGNGAIAKTYKYNPHYRWDVATILHPFVGYISMIRDIPESTNTHLDIRCFPDTGTFFAIECPWELDSAIHEVPDDGIAEYTITGDTMLPDVPFTPSFSSSSFSSPSSGSPKLSNKRIEIPTPLIAAYPNPFNTATTFYYLGFRRERLKIFIYDINGALIKVLYNGIIEAGNQRIIWDGKDENNNVVPTGVYIYKVDYENGLKIGKLIFVK